MDKKALSERDICTKFITPAITKAGWDVHTQIRENVHLTKGRVIVRGKLVSRGTAKFADYVLYAQPNANIPLAILEAKDNNHGVGDGMQQGLGYADMLDVPFVFSSNGDGFVLHDRTGRAPKVEEHLALDQFPSPEELWRRYASWKNLTPATEAIVTQDYYTDGSGKSPRYYQVNAINRVIEAVAKGQNRVLLVMATGTGKTMTAFQIIWRLWKAGVKKRILFLADRNILVDQTKTNDFKPFAGAMTKITNRKVDKSFEIYLALYQAISGSDEESDLFRQFSPEFFDLIIVDECHRGSASDNSAWRSVLDYFSAATQIGLTATPKETADVSTTHYFGEPVYTYSLKQGIEDGFLAPYKVVRIDLDKDVGGWRPEKGKRDKFGEEIEDRVYNQRDFDRTMVLEKRTELVAKKVTQFLTETNRYDKTIVFCEDIDHAERMRGALVNAMLEDNYKSPIPLRLRWRSWAKDAEGITGDELLDFVNNDLFKTLKELPATGKNAAIAGVVRGVFEDAFNYMKSGTLVRQVVNKLNEVDFNKKADRHEFGDIYEKILSELQNAGDAGEFYTPRAVTQFIVDQVDPKLGETILDPACGTGGFLTRAIEHVRKKYVKDADGEETLQASIRGIEKKAFPHLLCVTNMMFHGIEVPSNVRHDNTLARPLRDYGPKDRVDVIITNPPFGGMEEDGIENNFPANFRTRETADLFLVLLMTLLKPDGRAALVLPDGTLFGEGIKTRIKEKLLEECNLHTIVRLPKGVFSPYTNIKTNLLFFTKGEPTKNVWYYEHPYPEGAKSYSKSKPLRIEEFAPEKKWWPKRKETDQAWKVSIEDIKARAYNLDIKNPRAIDDGPGDAGELLKQYQEAATQAAKIRDQLRQELRAALEGGRG